MTLADSTIRKCMDSGSIVIEPFREDCLKAASYDFHLSEWFRVFTPHDTEVIDPKVDQTRLTKLVCKEESRGEVFILHPSEFVLASSKERFEFGTGVFGNIEGKSSLGRLGLQVHSTAGFFDPGFRGHPTLELSNVMNVPFKLYPGMLVGQMRFGFVDGKVIAPYGENGARSKYQDQGPEPAASRYFENYISKSGSDYAAVRQPRA